MIELFYKGGILFMSILTLIFLVVLALIVINFRLNQSGKGSTEKIALIRSVGLLALVTGIFGQCIGLYSALEFIKKAGSIAPDMLAGGISVSMITTMYGIIIFMVSFLASFSLNLQLKKP